MFKIVQRRYWYFLLSAVLIFPGLIALFARGGLPLSIDFTGGTALEVRFEQATAPIDLAVVRAAYAANGIDDVVARTSTTDAQLLLAQSTEISREQQDAILGTLAQTYGPPTVLSASTVGASVGQEVAQRAALAVALACVGILLYITFAFRNVQHAFRYGVCAIAALVHDVLVVLGAASLFGILFDWKVDALFLTATLTVVGFSVHDSIVVFDRIRENLNIYKRLDFELVVNHSVVQTLDRSINTQLTIMFPLLALALFGGDTTRNFVVVLMIGLISGTYSSIFNAAGLLVLWEKREWRTWFGRKPAEAQA